MWKAIGLAVLIGGCSTQAVFRDTLKPGGVERGQAELSVDSSACDFATNSLRPGIHFDTLHNQCMGAKGWALSAK